MAAIPQSVVIWTLFIMGLCGISYNQASGSVVVLVGGSFAFVLRFEECRSILILRPHSRLVAGYEFGASCPLFLINRLSQDWIQSVSISSGDSPPQAWNRDCWRWLSTAALDVCRRLLWRTESMVSKVFLPEATVTFWEKGGTFKSRSWQKCSTSCGHSSTQD